MSDKNETKQAKDLIKGDRFYLYRPSVDESRAFYMTVTVEAAAAKGKEERALQVSTDGGKTKHVTLGNQHTVRMVR